MLPLPTAADVANFSGRPESSYTAFINSAILQAALMMTTVTELQISDFDQLTADDQLLCQTGIQAMADYIYLRQPYQQVIASPLMNESIGSYSYGKAMQEVARNAAALEVTGERSGVTMYDLAVQMLAKRTRAGGVYSDAISVFDSDHNPDLDQAQIMIRTSDGRRVLFGPGDFNQFDAPFDVNSQMFPMDPGV